MKLKVELPNFTGNECKAYIYLYTGNVYTNRMHLKGNNNP